ncbi:hypothetical protein GCM10027440_00030 [Nocardiopsis coralliicola]
MYGGPVEVQHPVTEGVPEAAAERFPDGTRVDAGTAEELLRHAATGRTQWCFAFGGRALVVPGEPPFLYVAADTDLGAALTAAVGAGAEVERWSEIPNPYALFDGEEYATAPADAAFWERVRAACRAFPGPHLVRELWAVPSGSVYHDLTVAAVPPIAAGLKPNSLVSAWFTVPRSAPADVCRELAGLGCDDLAALDVRLRLVPAGPHRFTHALVDGPNLRADAERSDLPAERRYSPDPDFDTDDAWLHAHLTAVVPRTDGTVKRRWGLPSDWLTADLRPPSP